MPSFDAWDDANTLSGHLRQSNAELLVVIGAEQWCQKCQRLKPLFDALCAAQMPAHVAWMWLDLEAHGDFLSGFVPPDLPLLLRWRQGDCVQAAVVEDIQPERAAAERVRLRPLILQGGTHLGDADGVSAEIPALWAEFSSEAWAKG